MGRWTESEINSLYYCFSGLESLDHMLEVLPNRSDQAIIAKLRVLSKKNRVTWPKKTVSVYRSICYTVHKEVRKAYYETHKEEIINKSKAYYETHREEIKAYRKAHKEEIKKRDKVYYEANKEEIITKVKAHYAFLKTRPYRALGQYLESRLLEQKINYKKFAEQMGITKNTLTRKWFKGKSKLGDLNKVASILTVDVSELEKLLPKDDV